MVGNGLGLNNSAASDEGVQIALHGRPPTVVQFPVKYGSHYYFWFCRNPGLALPLIALQYHEVKV